MAEINVLCDKCKNTIKMTVNQSALGGLRWYASYICPLCGNALEMDGWDDLPQEFREAILADEGEWSLSIDDVKLDPYQLKVLRAALNLSMKEVAEVKRKIPGIITTGTKAEMQSLQLRFKSANVHVSIRVV